MRLPYPSQHEIDAYNSQGAMEMEGKHWGKNGWGGGGTGVPKIRSGGAGRGDESGSIGAETTQSMDVYIMVGGNFY
ncbi:hypothetical protein Taro_030275 [Colocasia esculenta]|uniref:Uncharacterized protein n=1 Tax=Colocasia esculenta TaxID=4460 RepID=A0A843VVP7_COLES|nr:hypothetical protein [Colocasia esculenta]